MQEPRHLRNAPITEAIIDFRVKARAGFRPEDFADLKTRLSERFPKVDEHRGLQVTLGVIKGQVQPPVVQGPGLKGYFFKSSDEKTIAQFRADGFTFNRLRPYTSWEDLFPQAIELWSLYCIISKPEVVTRLAVRDINRIELPGGSVTLETLKSHLRATPVIPPELPQSIISFLTRVTIRDTATDIAAHIAQALEGSAPGKQPAVILDIDAFMEREFSVDDPAIEQTFGQLREFKNLIFFNSLTDDALRRFE